MTRVLTTALSCGVLFLISLSTDRACADDQASIVGVWKVKSFVRKEVGTQERSALWRASHRLSNAHERRIRVLYVCV